MTAYVPIPNGDIDQDSPGTQPLFTAIRDNPIAMLEGATGAPYNHYAWHPYNGVAVGDGITGGFYDFAVDGVTASEETPDWVDGYEYRMVFEQIRFSAAVTVTIAPYRETSAAYAPFINLGAVAANNFVNGSLEFLKPRTLQTGHNIVSKLIRTLASDASGGGQPAELASAFPGVPHATAQKLLKAQVAVSGANINGGRLFLDKRRVLR